MKIFEIANVRIPLGNGCPVMKHVITRVNPEKKTKNRGAKFSRISSYELGHRADLCSRGAFKGCLGGVWKVSVGSRGCSGCNL